MLCALIGMAVVMFDCLIPEKLKEAFSVVVDSEEEDDSCSEKGYLNSVFLEGGTTPPLTSVNTIVSG